MQPMLIYMMIIQTSVYPGFAPAAIVSGGGWDNDAYFKDLRKDNIFIDRVSKMTTFPDDATAKHWIGIARFFRALDYSNFVFDFGDVALLRSDINRSGYYTPLQNA